MPGDVIVATIEKIGSMEVKVRAAEASRPGPAPRSSHGDLRMFFVKPETSAERREYYQRLEQKHAAPLWEVLSDLIPAQPRPTASPALWRYQEMRSLLLEAGRLITPQEAERRVLILENPSMPGTSLITQSMYSGLQLVDSRRDDADASPCRLRRSGS